MENEERNAKEQELDRQITFCLGLMHKLDDDFTKNRNIQRSCEYDDSRAVKNRSRFANDVRRIRRELLELAKMFESSW
jgi:hypothetical protein